MKKIAVCTTFSKEGWSEYAKRMVGTFHKFWPEHVHLHVYPDTKVALPASERIFQHDNDIPHKLKFLKRFTNTRYAGRVGDGYNYRFDARKFCHKPFAVHDLFTFVEHDYDWIIWLDADTITHRPIDQRALDLMTPKDCDVLYLGRRDKYSECGFYALRHPEAQPFLDTFLSFYTNGTFRHEAEWHDSFLFDLAMERVKKGMDHPPRFKSLTNFPRRQGGGHPFINSFLGEYMDHHKGNRKRVGRPRSGDLHVEHSADYWRKENEHARNTRTLGTKET